MDRAGRGHGCRQLGLRGIYVVRAPVCHAEMRNDRLELAPEGWKVGKRLGQRMGERNERRGGLWDQVGGGRELLARSIRVSKQRMQKLMQLHGIWAKGKRRFKVTTTATTTCPLCPICLSASST